MQTITTRYISHRSRAALKNLTSRPAFNSIGFLAIGQSNESAALQLRYKSIKTKKTRKESERGASSENTANADRRRRYRLITERLTRVFFSLLRFAIRTKHREILSKCARDTFLACFGSVVEIMSVLLVRT